MKWFDEALHDELLDQGYTQRFEVTGVVHRETSRYQDLLVFDSVAFGRVLALDGIVQTTERDEFTYHEMLAHVPIFAHGGVKSVLIVGGGDGGVLREVLKHDVERATVVEIDDVVIRVCRAHLPGISAGAFDDPRAEVVIADGVRFMEETAATFDVIVVDSTDPIGPAKALFGERFYGACKARLAPGGVLVTQSGVPFLQDGEAGETIRRLRPHFADVSFYLTVVPTYIGGAMALGWGSDDAGLRRQPESMVAGRYAGAGFETRYYSPAVHVAAFVLPPFVLDLMA